MGHGVCQPPLPEGHTITHIQHASYVAERCTPRYCRIPIRFATPQIERQETVEEAR
jgi:hypothetical protein